MVAESTGKVSSVKEDFMEKFKESFNNVENWVRETDKYAAGKIRGGNKCDLAPKRVVSIS